MEFNLDKTKYEELLDLLFKGTDCNRVAIYLVRVDEYRKMYGYEETHVLKDERDCRTAFWYIKEDGPYNIDGVHAIKISVNKSFEEPLKFREDYFKIPKVRELFTELISPLIEKLFYDKDRLQLYVVKNEIGNEYWTPVFSIDTEGNITIDEVSDDGFCAKCGIYVAKQEFCK